MMYYPLKNTEETKMRRENRTSVTDKTLTDKHARCNDMCES